tara:strand:+ start:493 stop:2064 length:1572 start_codon:yes stop_codon:yes gene_type:complete
VSNPLKYVTSTPTGTLRHANLGAGVSSIQYDETFNSGLNPSTLTTYYLVYEPVEGAAVRIYAPANAAELIQLAQSKGSTETTEAGALTWLSDNGYYPANKTLDNIVTDGLVLFIDSSTLTSYPGSGTDILDLSGTGADWTIPSDVFNSTTGVFNYASDQSSKSPPAAWQSTTDLTVEVLYKPNTGGIYTGCCDTIFGRYDFRFFQIDASLYAMIGFDDGNGTRIYQHPAYTVAYDRWHHVLAIRRNNKYIIWIDGVEMYNTTYGTGLALWDPTETYYISTTRHTNVDFAACRVYDKGLSDSEILQNYYQGPIVTDDLVFATDASNLSSFTPGETTAYNLAGDNDMSLLNGLGWGNGGNGYFSSDGVDDGLHASDASNLDLDDFTLEGWVWWDQHKNYGSLLVKGPGGSGNVFNYCFFFYSGNIVCGFGNGSAFYSVSISAPSINTWHHIVGTYDGATLKFYLNGTLASSTTVAETPYQNNNDLQVIQTSYPIDGRVGAARIYNRAITSEEVQQNYNANIKKFT